MPRHLLLIVAAAVSWVACLVALSWLASLVLDRTLSAGEMVLVGAVLMVVIAVVVQGRLQRDRRKLQDMRDSALW